MSVTWTNKLIFTKDPSDIVDFIMDWDTFLGLDTIDVVVISVTGNLTVVNDSKADNVVTVFISGGVAGAIETVAIKITTTNAVPRTFERSFRVKIEDL